MGLLGFGRDTAQAASNAIASNVSGPIDLIAWLLRKGGVQIKEPVGGSEWMAKHGLTAPVKNQNAGLLGETLGMVSPMLAVAKAPQIARGLLAGGENLAAPSQYSKQAGIFAGHLSKTADHKALATAKKLQAQGVPDEQIYKQTGWFAGMPDKQWRYEIPDNAAKLTGFDPTDKAVKEFQRGGVDAMKAFKSEYAGYKQPAYRDGVQEMGEVLEHPGLYGAYPDAADIRYLHQASNPKIGEGAFGSYHGRPIITTSPGNDPTMRGTQLHELQHYIQEKQGFAQGGSPQQLAVEWAQAKQRMDFDTSVAALAREAESAHGGSLDQAMATLNDLGFDLTPEHMQAAMQRGTAKAIQMGDASETALKQGFGNMSTYGGDPGNQLYNRLAGEAEARLVQSRMNMTPAELAASYPPSMFDVPIEQQIVRFK